MLAVLAAPGSTLAQHQHDGDHQHDTSSAAVANLKLDGEKKWATDAQYDALAARIEAQLNSVVANCKLPPAADANLHYVVADLMQGVSLMRGKDPQRTRHDGAALVHGALRAYPKYFDDPDWKP